MRYQVICSGRCCTETDDLNHAESVCDSRQDSDGFVIDIETLEIVYRYY